MYKVIIIDDENIIVQGLKRVIDWKKYDCEVVATANDATNGAIAIRKYNPDIVFTDIKMPNIDGLTMLAGLKVDYPNMQITVLTGYRDFAYAQQAIKIGVCRFLLKPSKMNELEEAIQTMVENLKRQLSSQQENNSTDVSDIEDTKTDSANSFIVRQAMAYIEENYAEKITLNDVAEKCYVSQWHLSKLINNHMNQTFYDILNNIRIKEAKKLLKDPKLRVSDISYMVGYTDTAHFSKVFKKTTSMSAQEYRNNLKT